MALLSRAPVLFRAAPLTRCCSCAPRAAPPCPPCTSPPQPPCRAPPITTRVVAHAACRPPSAGMRPPCPPAEPACSATCATNQTLRSNKRSICNEICGEKIEETLSDCGSSRDRVMARHAAAERARRREYEREVRERARAAPYRAPEPEYRLGTERLAARDADGREHAAPCGAVVRCELVPPDKCRRRSAAALNPCAHRTELRLDDIVRDAPDAAAPCAACNQAAAPPPPARPAAPPCDRQCADPAPAPSPPAERPARGLTSRIMERLSLSPRKPRQLGNGTGASCSRSACSARDSTAVLRAGPAEWCARPPSLAAPPPTCRPLALAERLRARKDKPGSGPGCEPRRQLHTAAGRLAAQKGPVGAGKLAEEAGVRVVLEEARPEAGARVLRLAVSAPSLPAVRLELQLNETGGAAAAAGGARGGCERATAASAAKSKANVNPCGGAGSAKSSSWLSNFQRKLVTPADGAKSASTTALSPTRVCPPPAPTCKSALPTPPAPAVLSRAKAPLAKCLPTAAPSVKPPHSASFTPHAIFVKSN